MPPSSKSGFGGQYPLYQPSPLRPLLLGKPVLGGSPAPCCWAQCAPELRPLLHLLAVWHWEYLRPLWAADSTGSHPRDVQATVSHLSM